MVFVPMTKALPKADANELLYSLQSEFDPWVYILAFDEGDFCRFAYENLPKETGLCRYQCFCVVDSRKASPMAIFKWKNLIEQLNLVSQWMKGGEGWMPTCANACQHGPTLHFGNCAEKDSLCERVVMAWMNMATNFTQTPKKNKNEGGLHKQ